MSVNISSEWDACGFASISLEREWKRACRRAQQYEHVFDANDDNVSPPQQQSNSKPSFTLINLWPELQPKDEEKEVKSTDTTVKDPWLQAALQIQGDLAHMLHWIRTKQNEYISLDLPESEASLIQSTVTSFTATTAQEVERLRSMVGSSHPASNTWPPLQTSIVSMLLDQLKEITTLFTILTKTLKRPAVHRWQHPLECRLWISSRSGDQRFLPTRPSHVLQKRVGYEYQQHQERIQQAVMHRKRPHSNLLFPKAPVAVQESKSADSWNVESETESTNETHSSITAAVTEPPTKKKLEVTVQKPMNNSSIWQHEDSEEEDLKSSLEREAVLLTAKRNSDLDAIQKMEQRMLDITGLLSQFTELVSTQQEDVWQIFDNTETSKENMTKGQEQLVNATERKKNSKHWMARAIFAMGCMLLFFHWLRP
jgi:hypothetical protein